MKIKYFIFVPVLFIYSCNYYSKTQETAETEILEQEKEPVRYDLTLIAAGDNLFHETIIRTHKQDDVYNFTPIYTEIKSLIENSDLAFINQETVMAGESFGYSGYPTFNTPQSLAQTLADTGFDIVNQANNHAMDMGRAGLHATLDLWDTIDGITVIGARKNGENHYIITKNNITLGFLSYTYGLNGFVLPAGEPNLVSLINRDRIAREINALRPLCDFLIVSVHWGEEYFLEPDPFQKNLALFFAEHNVDLIIGHHPHVLQPVVSLNRPDGKKTLCFYSLGNFVSNQREKERILGAMMVVTFTKIDSDNLHNNLFISNSGLIPVVCHFESGFTNTKVYPLYVYTQELLEKHYLRRIDSGMNFDFFKTMLNNLGTKMIMHNPMIN
ncbi:MAG: CapA family protein [Treponema sp.]|jgi:poly-gamma-glutamate synthesis protein (capsule biosynthesis protein)|nr:CapA family protein [Treponema sp.]